MMKNWRKIGSYSIGVLILIWSLLPIYHMVTLSITPPDEAFAGRLWPAHPTFENFKIVFTQDHFFLRYFWRQLMNSMFVAAMTAFLVLVAATLASYAIDRIRLKWGRIVSHVALFTYLIPAAFLCIPMYKVMGTFGLLNSPWALIFAMTTFATPYAIWVLRHYGDSLPHELDDAAILDGATPIQIYFMIYLPLMMPALIAIGTYAFLIAWNEYLYAFLMLSSEPKLTIPVMLGYFLVTDDAPWNLLMATSIIYALPPAALYYAVRHYMVAGLTFGAIKE